VLKLNLGCGSTKLEGYVNIDVEPACQPDLVLNFVTERLPYESETVDEVVMFHTIEHIQRHLHVRILSEIHRVLKNGGQVILSYPNFWICAQYWKENYQGQRDFWHATIFGRQLYPADYHVCAMDPTELEILLRDIGFERVRSLPEKTEVYNSITTGFAIDTKNYKDLLVEDLEGIIIR
jgi:SAM-dependent methyltransferase